MKAVVGVVAVLSVLSVTVKRYPRPWWQTVVGGRDGRGVGGGRTVGAGRGGC